MDLKDRYLTHCRVSGLRPRTIENYNAVLSEAAALGPLKHLTADRVTEYIDQQLNRNAQSTVCTKSIIIRAFITWAISSGELPADLIDQMPKPVKHRGRDPTVASRAQVQQLLPELRPKHKLSVLLMADAGLRVSEVVSLRVGDVRLDRGIIAIQSGKGGKARFAPLSTDRLRALLEQRVDGAEAEEWLLLGRNGAPLCRSAVNKAIARACERVGIDPLNPHAFRHSFAANAMTSGVHVKAIQVALGHSDLATTDMYLRSLSGTEELAHAFGTFSAE